MQMAKASNEEIQKVIDWANQIEEAQGHRFSLNGPTDEQCATLIRTAPPLFRIVFGYQVLVENCCDPNKDYLDFKPKIQDAIELQNNLSNK